MANRFHKFAATVRKRRVPLIVVILIVGAGVLTAAFWGKKSGSGAFFTAKVERGTVELDVLATGTVQAVTTVQVGSQVSGTLSWLGADYKSRVKSGQVIAKLEPAIFQAQLDQAKANLRNAKAAVDAAKTDVNNSQANVVAAKANAEAAEVQAQDSWDIVKRDQELTNIIAARDLQGATATAKANSAKAEQAKAQIGQAQAALASSVAKLAQAQAAVGQNQAQVDLAQVNLDHCVISSPIDGVVVSRSVDVGQTVAASLQAPTLFTIANDLKNMQVLANIDEADVGQVQEGIPANFSVDAFPGQTFTGKISQIRLNAQTLQNVVTYTTVIDFQNPDEKLLPGMTANVTVPVAKHDNVLTLPNSALRFKPQLSDKDQKELQAKIDAMRQQYQAMRQQHSGAPGQPGEQNQPEEQGKGEQAKPRGNQPGPGSHQGQPGQGGQVGQFAHGQAGGPNSAGQGGSGGQGGYGNRGPGGPQQGFGGQGGAGPQGGKGQSQPKAGQSQLIYMLGADGKLQPLYIRVGITNGRVTEISGKDLAEGQVIVIGQNDITQGQSGSPFGRRGFGR